MSETIYNILDEDRNEKELLSRKPASGRVIKEDFSVVNWADLLMLNGAGEWAIRMALDGGNINGDVTIVGSLTVTEDLLFNSLGSNTMSISGYIQGVATGKKYVAIGDATSAHSLVDIDDFVVKGKSEFQDVAYFDGDINTNGNFQLGSSTVDTGVITMIKGAQTGDPQVIMALTDDANGDFSITTDTGDITLASASYIYFKTEGSLRVAIGPSLITIPKELKTNNATIPMLLTSRVSDGASAVAFTMDSDNALSTAGAKIVSFTNNSVEKAYIDKDGKGVFNGVDGGSSNITTSGQVRADTFGPVGGTAFRARGAIGATGIGNQFGNLTTLTAGGKIVSFYNDTFSTEKAYIDYLGLGAFGKNTASNPLFEMAVSGNDTQFRLRAGNGDAGISLTSNGTVAGGTVVGLVKSNNWALGFQSGKADGASSIAHIFDTASAYSTSGAKLLSIQNNAVEKAYVDYSGAIYGETNKRVALGGGNVGAGTTPNGTVTLEINGTSYYLLTSASA